jgi:hypothetical protein
LTKPLRNPVSTRFSSNNYLITVDSDMSKPVPDLRLKDKKVGSLA